jgi:hypothetical protein
LQQHRKQKTETENRNRKQKRRLFAEVPQTTGTGRTSPEALPLTFAEAHANPKAMIASPAGLLACRIKVTSQT